MRVVRGKPSRKLYTEDELKKHKKGKDHIAKEIARQESLSDYEQLEMKPIPSHLCYYGKQEWKRIIPLLQQLPIAELDRQMIESYCQLHGFKRRLQKDIQDNGQVDSFFDKSGNLTGRRINPSYNAYLSTVKELRMIANQLGMTINSRLELSAGDEEIEEDEILKLLKG